MSKELEEIIKKSKEKKIKEFFSKLEESFKNSLVDINFPEKIEISNIDQLLEKINSFPDSFSIDNLEEISKYIVMPEQKFPESFKIENIDDIAKHISIPKQKDFPKEFRISNLKEIKIKKTEIPENIKDLSFKKTELLLKDIYDKVTLFLKSAKDSIFVSNSKPSEAIPVRMVTKDGNDFTEMRQNVIGMPTVVGSKNINNEQINPAQDETLQKQISATPNEYNVSLAVVDTEYSQVIPDGAKKIQFWSRNDEDIRFSFTTGKVATPTAPYLTHKGGMSTHEGELYLTGKTIYFATDVAGDVVEMLIWV